MLGWRSLFLFWRFENQKSFIHKSKFKSSIKQMKKQELKKKILIYAHYYFPDVASTGQLLRELAEGMLEQFDITVVCTVPSYSGKIAPEYQAQQFYYENINEVSVVRIRVPEFQKSNKISRLKNILAYFIGARKVTRRLGNFDFILAISQPPVLGGLLGVYGKRKKQAQLIYNIQDFNPEQILAVKYSSNKLITDFMLWMDKQSCKKSDLVITVGRDLAETMQRRFSRGNMPRTIVINNWIDEQEVYPLEKDDPGVIDFKNRYGLSGKFVFMYSGNIGLYYDLENILKVIERFRGAQAFDGREVAFVFVGAGAVLEEMVHYKKEKKLDNVVFVPYQKKEQLICSLNAGDVHWCVNAKGIKGVSCPSKIYGIMAVGKPVLGVLEEGTEARYIIEECGCGKCCEPEDYENISKLITWYLKNDTSDMGMRGRKYLEHNLMQNTSIRKYCAGINGLLQEE